MLSIYENSTNKVHSMWMLYEEKKRKENAFNKNLYAMDVVEVVVRVGAKQPIHWFLEGKSSGIQQGTSVLVGSPKSGGEIC